MRKMTFGILAIAGFFLLQGAMLWIQNIKSADAQTMICVPEQKKIVQGTVAVGGGACIPSGEGYTVSCPGGGHSIIYFDEPFSSIPTVVATPTGSVWTRYIVTYSASTSMVDLAHINYLGQATGGPFAFIAVGDQ